MADLEAVIVRLEREAEYCYDSKGITPTGAERKSICSDCAINLTVTDHETRPPVYSDQFTDHTERTG